MTGPQRKKYRKESVEFYKVLASLSENKLRVLVKYLNGIGIDLIGTLVHNLTNYKNPTLNKEGRKQLQKCIIENPKLINYLRKPTNSRKGKRKKLQHQNGAALLTTLLTVGIPVLAEIIASAVR